MKTRDLVLIAMFAALMALCAWITIPSLVPFTMQTFAVFMAVNLLGGRRGTLAVAVYVLLGAVGLPVFSGFGGGAGVLFGKTGGTSSLSRLGADDVGRLSDRGRGFAMRIVAMLAGLIVCYAFGTIWFMNVYMRTNGPVTLMRCSPGASSRTSSPTS